MQTYTVGEISKIVGLPTKTIRFYEEAGVVEPPQRRENGYREYEAKTVERLKVLKYARDLGLPLSEIKKLLMGCENGDCDHSQEYIERLVDNYVSRLEARITEMQTLKGKLLDLKNNLAKCYEPGSKFCCDILHQLEERG